MAQSGNGTIPLHGNLVQAVMTGIGAYSEYFPCPFTPA